MRLASILGLLSGDRNPSPSPWRILTSLSLIQATVAINFTPVAAPNLDLSQIGRVALAGDFDSISLYSYEGQEQGGFSTHGSQSLLTRYPNGAFAMLQSADAHIQTMCPFQARDGTLHGIVVGGNFTSLGGVEAQGIALYSPTRNSVTALPGLSGSVSSVYCDRQSETVYVGGSFTGGNSTNAISWTSGWTNLPFAGFNGPVYSITKAPNGNVIFAGLFDGLGNTPVQLQDRDEQVVNLFSANITAGGSTTMAVYTDPSNIVCKTSAESGPGNSWLLADNQPGYWQANFRFGFRPTKIRLYNTQVADRGTRTWRFTALPLNGILNLTYIDPNGQEVACQAQCPLPANTSAYQDFRFVNSIGMNAFRIDISDWYGVGGGLGGIELFSDEIISFAVNTFNEPSCDSVSTRGASAVATGPWTVTPAHGSTSDYLTARLNSSSNSSQIDPSSASLVFKPNIKKAGNYSITLYTPGCIADDTCRTRGIVNLTGFMGNPTRAAVQPVSVQLYQTNNYDKYDPIYYGYVDTTSDAFAPSITLKPAAGQSAPLTVVAQRVRFQLVTSTGGLNGLFEFNPNNATVDTDFSKSVMDQAGMNLNTGALVSTLAVHNNVTYAAGNFSADTYNNIMAVTNSKSSSLPGGGLNAPVHDIYQNGSLLYIGGDFTNTRDNKSTGLNHLAVFSISDNTWQPLGAGVNGVVYHIVPITLKLTNNQPELAITINGYFTEVLAFGANASFAANDFAVWIPSRKNWLHNLGIRTISIHGELTTHTEVPGTPPYFAGTLSSGGLDVSGAVSLATGNNLALSPLPVNIQPQQVSASAYRKRAVSGQNVTGVVTGLFYEQNSLNITVLGGHFTATGTNGSNINNLVFINGSDSNRVSGVGNNLNPDSVFLALSYQGTQLFAGGTLSGSVSGNNVNGLIVYDLKTSNYIQNQPPALQGSNVAVNAIAPRPSSTAVYVAGSFDSAGSFGCPALCVWDTSTSQWNSPGSGLGGSVAALTWASSNQLIIGGNLTVNGTATSLATYDAQRQAFTSFDGGANVPGPVTALTAANDASSEFWVAGKSTNGSAFLERYNGNQWLSVGDTLGSATTIRGLQVMRLTRNHASSTLLANNQVLLITGQLSLMGFGSASAALFNGTTFSPFILSSTASGAPGSLSQAFVQNPHNLFANRGGNLAVGFVVLIALAIALALIFLLVVLGILAERIRRRREGYVPAPTQPMFEKKNSNVERIPPEHLFGSIGRTGKGVGNG